MDVRAEAIQEEYKKAADVMDGHLGDEVGMGRCRRKLEQFGELVCVVVGTFNEASADTLVLLDAMAAARVAKLARASGIQRGRHKVEKGNAQGQLRRWLSTASLRASMA